MTEITEEQNRKDKARLAKAEAELEAMFSGAQRAVDKARAALKKAEDEAKSQDNV